MDGRLQLPYEICWLKSYRFGKINIPFFSSWIFEGIIKNIANFLRQQARNQETSQEMSFSPT